MKTKYNDYFKTNCLECGNEINLKREGVIVSKNGKVIGHKHDNCQQPILSKPMNRKLLEQIKKRDKETAK